MHEFDALLSKLAPVADNEFHLRELVKQVQTESGVAPFVGAGLSAPLGLATWGKFLANLAIAAGLEREVAQLVRVGQYEEAAEQLRARLGARRFDDLLEGEYGEHRLDNGPLRGAARLIPRLARRAVITTNFDRVLERAFAEAGQQVVVVFGADTARSAAAALQQDKNLLLKLHGDCSTSLGRVLTLDEYRKTYGRRGQNDFDLELPIPALLQAILVTRSVLFLGCSLTADRTVQALLNVSLRLGVRSNYAVLAAPSDPAALRERAARLADMGVRTIWHREGDFERVEELVELLVKARTRPPLAHGGAASAPAASTAAPSNLPSSSGTIIGRGTELETLAALVGPQRLTTIVGAPGIGKTRLALELGRAVASRFADGVCWVELDSLREERLVPQRVAHVLGLREQADQPPQDALRLHLRRRALLLLLDNTEHVTRSCAELVQFLIESCPDLRVIATSRTPLRAADEYVYELSTLASPPLDESDLGALAESESVALLLERAAARGVRLTLTRETARPIRELCRALDGLPLAIQLAAARLRSLSVHEIAARLTRGVDVLRATREVGRRQWETLTAALGWSYELLAAQEQRLLRRLALFDGGFQLAAAHSICCGEGCDEAQALESLEALIDQSLVVRCERAGSSRYRLLEPIRQYALDLLQTSGESLSLQETHARWFLHWAEAVAPRFTGPSAAAALDEVTAEIDNLRAAFRWFQSRNDGDGAQRWFVAMWRFYEIRGFFREGRERAAAALAVRGASGDDTLFGRASSGAGMLAYRQGDWGEARAHFERALALARAGKDPLQLANALNDLGICEQRAGAFERARTLLAECLEIERASAHHRGVGAALFNLGCIEFQLEQLQRARELFDESCDAFRAAGAERDLAFPLNWLALCALRHNELPRAASLAEQSLEIRTRLGDKRGMAETRRTLALVDLARAAPAAALESLIDSFKLISGVGDQRGAAETLECLAAQAVAARDPAHAARLCGAAKALRERARVPALPFEHSLIGDVGARAARELGTERFERRWDEGANWPASELLELVTSGPAS